MEAIAGIGYLIGLGALFGGAVFITERHGRAVGGTPSTPPPTHVRRIPK